MEFSRIFRNFALEKEILKKSKNKVVYNSLIMKQLDIKIKYMYKSLIIKQQFSKFFPKLFGKLLNSSYLCQTKGKIDNILKIFYINKTSIVP